MEHLLKYLSAVCVSSFENFAQSTDPFIGWQCCLRFKLFISLSFPTSLSPLALLSACSVCLCAIWLCVVCRIMDPCVHVRRLDVNIRWLLQSLFIEQSSLFLTGMGGQQAPQDPSVAPLTCTVVAGACHHAWLATWVHSNHYILWATAPSLEFFTCFGGEPPVWTTASNDFLPCCGLSVHSTDLALQQLCDFMQSHVSIIGASFCVV